ncbi:MAG: helix-turn-helix transcriptional regulator [Ignavibacteria bacterium]|nr:helix-turn-helix transcriptional regulator [Ignavibacteria bacterium]
MSNYLKESTIKTSLRKYRFENGELSQQQLADTVKVSRQTIVAIERGDYNLSVKLALQLARKLNTTVENLFQLEEKDHA